MRAECPDSKPKKIKVDGAHKRKQPLPKKPASKSNVTDHYMIFLQKSLNCMDLFPEMKGFDIVLDNAPFHRADEIAEIISKKEYRSIYLPPYFLRLNLIKNFWTRRKSYVKKAKFDGTDDLKTRVSEASNKVRPSTLRSIISQLSVNRFDLCECGLFNKPYIDRFQL